MNRTIVKQVQGYETTDGAGVRLVRVLGAETAGQFDPFLMLDSFDSQKPEQYIQGFPMHPHRGIETISFLSQGKMIHRDSLGFEDSIADGEVQWMTAGSGILHEEKLPASSRLLGVQLWLNLPRKDKMISPAYHSLKAKDIPQVPIQGGHLRVLAGQYEGVRGFEGPCLPLDYYDIRLKPHAETTLRTPVQNTVMVFTLREGIRIQGRQVPEKTAVLLSPGDSLTIKAGDKGSETLVISSTALKEPIAWSGPIVMNTREEIRQAFDDLDRGQFLKT